MAEQNKKRLKFDMGRSLRVLMSELNVRSGTISKDLKISGETVSTLRKGELMSGKNLQIFCDYFNINASAFLAKGEF